MAAIRGCGCEGGLECTFLRAAGIGGRGGGVIRLGVLGVLGVFEMCSRDIGGDEMFDVDLDGLDNLVLALLCPGDGDDGSDG